MFVLGRVAGLSWVDSGCLVNFVFFVNLFCFFVGCCGEFVVCLGFCGVCFSVYVVGF